MDALAVRPVAQRVIVRPVLGRSRNMVLHWVFRARHVREIGGEVRHGATSVVSCETSLDKHEM